MDIDTRDLERLLKVTKRNQYINGKEQAQVVSCMLRPDDERITTTSVVRDGKTSVARFSIMGDGFTFPVPVPDIDRMLGALKYHGQKVSLTLNDNKLVVKSGRKTTTMSANADGRAFPNNHATIGEWETMSRTLGEKIVGNKYKLNDGTLSSPFYTFTIDAEDIFDALRCDEMNGQRMNSYTFMQNEGVVSVVVGDHLKGQTEITLADNPEADDWEITFSGGLEYALKHFNGTAELNFFDFTTVGQGYRLLISLGGGDYILQASVM